ncbi:MAG TPA: HAMP domain-containing sensor histidine kinase [Burkholderiaceae bacterium]|nr:HAMP domain-containing sensor histidine kinase [Burkholderiaceae bacterium]
MKSLRARVLLLIVGFGLMMAALLAIIMHASVRQYYSDWMYAKNAAFAQRVLEAHPDLWRDYSRDPAGFGATLRQYTLYSPNTGLYLLDLEGRVLATAGERQPFWTRYRVDLQPVTETMQMDPALPIVADDPDTEGRRSLVAAHEVVDEGKPRGWLYVVARQTDIDTAMPALLKSYAIRAASTAGLMTIAIGVLLTIAMISLLTRPLTALTRATERIRNSGFSDQLCDDFFPDADRDDEIGRLSRTFREAFDRLRQETERVRTVDAHRREMVASVSHDLRTPLTALIGQIETIRLKGDALPPDAQAHLLDRALHNAQHLKRLTDALAELARLDSPEFRAQPEPIAIGELADDVVQRFASAAQQAGVTLGVEYPDGLPLTRADAALIERALSNLIDNALRVTPSGGRVLVRALREGDGVRIEVADTGPGVASEDQPRVFERFYQTSRHREHRGSSGLGLAIVKRVAELHGGTAGLRSEPGRGSTFFIDLPLTA